MADAAYEMQAERARARAQLPAGTRIRVGKTGSGILVGYAHGGTYYGVRRIRNGKPCKAVAWYLGTPAPAARKTRS